jgi:hypothetical protein
VRRRIVFLTGAFIVAAPFVQVAAAVGNVDALPLSCFVVHCEPTNANEAMFRELIDLVALADEWGIPLSIDFTAQWAEMVLADDEKVSALQSWLDVGHEIACHHHSYWATLDRGAQWDGYTNTPLAEILPSMQDLYRGTMDDYMGLLTALPGERTSACMGLGDENDLIDWPEELPYSTSGHTLEDCVSEPFVVDYAGADAWQITHGLILQDPGALSQLYESTPPEKVFAVVGHVYNFQEGRRPFEFWFRYLHGGDPDGARRRTVAALMEEWVSNAP